MLVKTILCCIFIFSVYATDLDSGNGTMEDKSEKILGFGDDLSDERTVGDIGNVFGLLDNVLNLYKPGQNGGGSSSSSSSSSGGHHVPSYRPPPIYVGNNNNRPPIYPSRPHYSKSSNSKDYNNIYQRPDQSHNTYHDGRCEKNLYGCTYMYSQCLYERKSADIRQTTASTKLDECNRNAQILADCVTKYSNHAGDLIRIGTSLYLIVDVVPAASPTSAAALCIGGSVLATFDSNIITALKTYYYNYYSSPAVNTFRIVGASSNCATITSTATFPAAVATCGTSTVGAALCVVQTECKGLPAIGL